MEIHAADYRADQKQVWSLGSIRIWFKEGQDDVSNEGIDEEYKPGQTITYTFRPEAPESSLVVRFTHLIKPFSSQQSVWV